MRTGIYGINPLEYTGSIPTDLLNELLPSNPIARTSSTSTSGTCVSFPFLRSPHNIDINRVLREAALAMS